MIEILNVEAAGIPTLVLPDGLDSQTESSGSGSCHHCASYRPDPQLSGNLQVDPDIHLPSVGLDVDIAFYYNSNAWNGAPFTNAAFGYQRTISPAQAAQLYGFPQKNLIIERGNGAV